MKKILTLALAALAITACKKDKNEDHMEFEATITVSSPSENDTITGGTSFLVTGSIAANMEMHGYHVELYNSSDNSLLYENEYHEHSESFTLNETVTHALTAQTALKLKIEAAGDHEGSTVTKEVHLTYIP